MTITIGGYPYLTGLSTATSTTLTTTAYSNPITYRTIKNEADMLNDRKAAVETVKSLGADAREQGMFGDLMMYIWKNPEVLANNRGRGGKRPNVLVEEGVRNIAERWYKGRKQKPVLKRPQTIVDPAVEQIMAIDSVKHNTGNFPMPRRVSDHVMHNHIKAMAAENLVGTLLEMYLAQALEHRGWIWCSGEVIKAVDFIRRGTGPRDQYNFVGLQVKNRSNSENSSSAAIRAGTTIEKWHRLNARTGKTNWENFPHSSPVPLSEENFQKFIRETLV